jgi:hypothetical protein
MMIDDDTLKQLLRINDDLFQLCKRLNEKRDMDTSSSLIPLVDDLTVSRFRSPCCTGRTKSSSKGRRPSGDARIELISPSIKSLLTLGFSKRPPEHFHCG